MNTITPKLSPSFGMAVKFNNQGRKFFEEVFAHKQELGDKFIKNQAHNSVSDIIAEGPNKVFLTLNGQKWQVINSMRIFQNTMEEVMLLKCGNIISRPKIKIVVCEPDVPFVQKYGENGRLLATAEYLADFEADKAQNQKPGLIKRLTSYLNNA